MKSIRDDELSDLPYEVLYGTQNGMKDCLGDGDDGWLIEAGCCACGDGLYAGNRAVENGKTI